MSKNFGEVLKRATMAADVGPVSIPPGVTTGPRPSPPAGRSFLMAAQLWRAARPISLAAASRVSAWLLRSIETTGPAETESLGAELAGVLTEGERGARSRRAGAPARPRWCGAPLAPSAVGDPVTSPTFSIGHRYTARQVTVTHVDLYRLAGLEHEDPGLLADYIGPGRIAFVEWAAGRLGRARRGLDCGSREPSRGGDRRRIEVGDLDERGEGGGD